MPEYYYAVERSGDHLAHVGVKGMKWGVRKKKNRKYFTKQDFKDAVKAAGLSLLMGPSASMYMASRKAVNTPNKQGKKTSVSVKNPNMVVNKTTVKVKNKVVNKGNR